MKNKAGSVSGDTEPETQIIQRNASGLAVIFSLNAQEKESVYNLLKLIRNNIESDWRRTKKLKGSLKE